MVQREIKFRAWVNGRGMYPIDGFEQGHMITIYPRDSRGVRMDAWTKFKDDITLMQFTGLLDKNGTEIYEGDIVKVEEYEKYRHREIVFKDGTFTVEDNDDKLYAIEPKFTEVIGNIYENPELLKDCNE